MSKTKVPTITKVYGAAKMLFKKGKPLPLMKIAKKAKTNYETTRKNVLALVSKNYITRDEKGRITNVK